MIGVFFIKRLLVDIQVQQHHHISWNLHTDNPHIKVASTQSRLNKTVVTWPYNVIIINNQLKLQESKVMF